MRKKIRRKNQEKHLAAIRRRLVTKIVLCIVVVHAVVIPLSMPGPMPAPPSSSLPLLSPSSTSIKSNRLTIRILVEGKNLDLESDLKLQQDLNRGRVELEKNVGTDIIPELEWVRTILSAVLKTDPAIDKNPSRVDLELGKNGDEKTVGHILSQLPNLPIFTTTKTMATASSGDSGHNTTENAGDAQQILVDLCPVNKEDKTGALCDHHICIRKYVANWTRSEGAEWQDLPLAYGFMSSIFLLSLSASICFFYYWKFQQNGQVDM